MMTNSVSVSESEKRRDGGVVAAVECVGVAATVGGGEGEHLNIKSRYHVWENISDLIANATSMIDSQTLLCS